MREPGHDAQALSTHALRAAMVVGLMLVPLAGPGVRPASAGRVAAGEAALDTQRAQRELQGYVLKTVDGRSLALDALRGQVVVLNFWASWCPPCRRELPHLDALQTSLAGGARVVAISIDEEPRNVERFARAQRLSLPLYHDGPDHLARRLDLPQVPFTIVLDRRGEVVLATGGADDRALDAVAATARRLVAAAPAPSPTVAGGTP